jgi:1,4-alpha-glucan branching enzyme
MARKGQKVTGRKRVTFKLENLDAGEVILMGDFNTWDDRKHEMKRSGRWEWSKTMVLAPGTYEYKLLVDGQWQNDPQNDHLVPNCFGTFNNVLIVQR